MACTQTDGRHDDDLSYRGLFDYNGDRYGFTVERLVVEPNFLPEIRFLRRTDMRRNFVQTGFSPRVPYMRRFTTQASINQLTNNQNRLDTRELVGLFQTELINTDVVGVMYTDTFDRPVRPFDVATGVRIPGGGYDFHTLQVSYTGGQQRKISGAIVYETGTYYGGTQQSISSRQPSCALARRTPLRHTCLSAPSLSTTRRRKRQAAICLGWEYAPGTELLVVYTDDYDTQPRPQSTALRNRAFVIKVNRLFRPWPHTAGEAGCREVTSRVTSLLGEITRRARASGSAESGGLHRSGARSPSRLRCD